MAHSTKRKTQKKRRFIKNRRKRNEAKPSTRRA